MKVFTLLLGYYSNRIPFYLFQVPDTSNLLFKLSDISTLFNVTDLAHHPLLNHIPQGECYCQKLITGDTTTTTAATTDENSESSTTPTTTVTTTIEYYVSVQALARIAISMNKYRLAELCKLKPNDYSAGLADSILKNISSFEQVTNQQFQSTELPLSPTTSPLQSPKQQQQIETNNNNSNNSHSSKEQQQHNSSDHHDHNDDGHNASQSPQAHPVKSEPLSPPPLRLSQPKDTKEDQRNTNPMSLGKVLWSNGQGSQSPATRSHPDDDNLATNNNKRQRTERKVLPKPAHTVSSQHSYPNALNTLANKHGQTLLAKRQGKNSRHLTIFAPSYADHLSVAIRSAPLNSNFRNGQPLPSGVPGTSTIPSQQNQAYSQQQQQHLQHHQQQHHQHGQSNSNQPATANTATGAGNGMTIATGGSTSLHPSFHHSSLRQPPKTATTLQPGHTLAPLLSPRAAPVLSSQHHGNPSHSLHHSSSHHHHLHHPQPSGHHHHLHHPEPKTTGGAIGKQEFAIPPIVPSQQQPPHTAHPHNASASNFGRPHSTSHGYPSKATSRLDPLPQSNNNSNNNSSNSNSSNTGNGTNGNGNNNNNVNTNNSLPLTASAAPMPPQTPTTFSFAALQRQQFLQPFEQLFDTIETTRTLKTTLDDQIRRSSTLLQTLQASSTTVEALIRSQIKEVQKDVMNRMDDLMDGMMKRIIQLESRLEIESSNNNSSNQHQPLNRKPTSPPPTSSSSLSETNGNANLKSPPTIVRSQNDIGSSEYQSVLNTLRERLDKLEKSIG